MPTAGNPLRPARPRGSRTASRGVAGLTALALAGTLAACQLPNGDRDTGLPAEPSQGAAARPGQDTIGDPYVPGDGNAGYDVQHYGLKLAITPGGAEELDGTAEITATATQRLPSFNLDLTGLRVSQVTVDGAAARQRQDGEELTVSPAKPVEKGARFTVAVRYSGTPRPVNDPILGRYGWIRTPDGVFVACQPSGAHTWFPSNDHPSDKATFDFEITVPDGLTAIANGEPATPLNDAGGGAPEAPEAPGAPDAPGAPGDPGAPGGPGAEQSPAVTPISARRSSTTKWRVKEPMATYLATVTVGRFGVTTSRTPGGVTNISAVDPTVPGADLDVFHAKNAQITDELARRFGPYPFSSTGGIVDNAQVGFALETQTRPVYGAYGIDDTLLAHELAHQWFGDSVSVTRWKDIWLNEGFATYAEWMWAEKAGGQSVQARFDELYADRGNRELWDVPPGNPGRSQMFARSVYDRGGMTLHALRTKVGDAKFFQILQTWTRERRHSSGTTEQFIEVAERVSGQKLGSLFDDWLYKRGRPGR
ncbi:M1 family metallopeptidase [Actinomadura miaoliensis]|uniref:M1 family metallopeptidase n=1 Tax=Actinomadura miaoliensis TaxID=430685 RepID=A0ABP7X8E3_9ACTN